MSDAAADILSPSQPLLVGEVGVGPRISRYLPIWTTLNIADDL